jgi:hypothetical protein
MGHYPATDLNLGSKRNCSAREASGHDEATFTSISKGSLEPEAAFLLTSI